MTPTMKKVIAETCCSDDQAALFRAVIRQMNATWKEVWEYPSDNRDASAGVGGFTYYTETEKFATCHMAIILKVCVEFEEDMGTPLKKDTEHILNWYAWFALEHIIDKVICYKESLSM